MRKFALLAVLLIALVSAPQLPAQAGKTVNAPQAAAADDLISAVNALRASKSLPPFQTNAVLMGIAQAQAEYMASLQMAQSIHTDANGLKPYQRALNAGYLVAGDLSQGGIFGEAVTAGQDMTADQAIQKWMADSNDQKVLLSTDYQDVGAGVAVNGLGVYFCLDAGLSTGGTPVAYTPPGPRESPTPTLVVSTPNPDGSIVHIIQPGDTVLAIAIAYGVSPGTIYNLNNISATTLLIPGHKLLIQTAFTPTPTLPTGTPTPPPTETSWPTSTPTVTGLPATPTPLHSAGLTTNMAGMVVIAIAVAAMVVAALVTLVGTRKPKK